MFNDDLEVGIAAGLNVPTAMALSYKEDQPEGFCEVVPAVHNPIMDDPKLPVDWTLVHPKVCLAIMYAVTIGGFIFGLWLNHWKFF
jgi:hypothetical protein